MDIRKIIALIVLLSTAILSAQAPAIQWQKCYGGIGVDEAICIRQTTDGGYIFAGMANRNSGDVTGVHSTGIADFWIVKLNSTGTIQWQKSLGGSKEDYANSIEQTSDGGYIVAGQTFSTDGDVTGNHSSNFSDCWVVKLTVSGNIEWQKTYGGTANDAALSIKQTADGGYIMGGVTNSIDGDVTNNHGDQDIWVVKLYSDGTLDWQKCYGGTDIDLADNIYQLNDSNFLICGSTYSSDGDIAGNQGQADYCILKIDSTGVLQWLKTYGGFDVDFAKEIQTTDDGGMIVAGNTFSNNGDIVGNHGSMDYWILKLAGTGDIEWQKTLGSTDLQQVFSVKQTIDGGYLFAGMTYGAINGDVTISHGDSDVWLVKLSNIGALQWQKSFGGTGGDYARSIAMTSDSGFIVAGASYSNNIDLTNNHGQLDCWIIKLTPENLGLASFENDRSFTLYPNPTTSLLEIRNTNARPIESIDVFDSLGKRVIHQTDSFSGVDVRDFPSGAYQIQIQSGNRMTIKKFIKE